MLKEFNQVHATYIRAKWLILKLFHPLVYERLGFRKGEGLRERRGGHHRGGGGRTDSAPQYINQTRENRNSTQYLKIKILV